MLLNYQQLSTPPPLASEGRKENLIARIDFITTEQGHIMTTNSATYSPEDNKQRFCASSRLDPDLYARVRAAGIIWGARVQRQYRLRAPRELAKQPLAETGLTDGYDPREIHHDYFRCASISCRS